MKKRHNTAIRGLIIWICAVAMALPPGLPAVSFAEDCLDIADAPFLDVGNPASSNIFFLIDDSGSMDWEFLCADGTDGRWPYGSTHGCYLYGDEDYSDSTDSSTETDDNFFSSWSQYGYVIGQNQDSRAKWKATWSEYNALYYNPETYYEPWIQANGSPMDNADINKPISHPVTTDFPSSPSIHLDNEWVTLGDSAAECTGCIVVDDNVLNNSDNKSGVDWDGNWADSSGTYPYDAAISDDSVAATEDGSWFQWYHTFDQGEEDAGPYHVDIWVSCYATRDTAAEYEVAVVTNQSTTTVRSTTIDQHGTGPYDPEGDEGCGKWVRITDSALTFQKNEKATVTVTRGGANTETSTSADAIRFIPSSEASQEPASTLTIPIAHYYTWYDEDNDEVQDDGEIYLVILESETVTKYYQMTTIPADTGDGNCGPVTMENLTEVSSPPAAVMADAYNDDWPSGYSARQNFANWFQYYRRRYMTSIYAISKAINNFSNVYIGVGGFNALQPNIAEGVGIAEPVTAVRQDGADNSAQLLEALFNYYYIEGSSSTPMRSGYLEVGQYFHTEQGMQPSDKLGTSPITGDAGKCQKNFVIVFTDGYYNGGSAGTGNVDDDVVYADEAQTQQISGIAPYISGATNTFADLVMLYYAYDIAPDVADEVDTFGGMPPDLCPSYVEWQHLITFTVTLGVTGTIDPNGPDGKPDAGDDGIWGSTDDPTHDDPTFCGTELRYPDWPSPINDDPEKIDDIFHGAVNGRGKYFSAKNPTELVDAFDEISDMINSMIGTGARATVSSSNLVSGTMLFRVSYDGLGWAGKLTAENLGTSSNFFLGNAWEAHTLLEANIQANGHTGRNIATMNGSGVPFEWNRLSSDQQTALMYTEVTSGGLTGNDLVNYLRGEKTYENRFSGGMFRSRMTREFPNDPAIATTPFTLGDIHHSPAIYDAGGDAVYVGANDGMLHAFDGTSGEELFAYVPSFVYDHLNELSKPDYDHKYYVDGITVIRDTGDGASDKTYLVGGLGKGGKGYYCLDITDPSANTQANASSWVKWEFPNSGTLASDTNAMGYTFGTPAIVKSQQSGNPWIAILSNGYLSDSGTAALFIVDVESGDLLKAIDTGVTGCNGLSDPFPTDPNGDQIVDYVYAGDLKGNLWKFDLTSDTPADWSIAYGTDPLFQAKDSSGDPQPITGTPNVMAHCDEANRAPGYIVVFGTGKMLGESDKYDSQQHSAYGIWDFGDDEDDGEYPGSFTRSSATCDNWHNLALVQNTVDFSAGSVTAGSCISWELNSDYSDTDQDSDPKYDGITVTDTNCDDSDYGNPANLGWFLDFPMDGERSFGDVLIIEGLALFVTLSPDSSANPCSTGGSSGLYLINACDGSDDWPDELTSFVNPDDSDGSDGSDGSGDDTLGPATLRDPLVEDLTVIYDPETDQHLVVTTELDGDVPDPDPSPTGRRGLIFWRQID